MLKQTTTKHTMTLFALSVLALTGAATAQTAGNFDIRMSADGSTPEVGETVGFDSAFEWQGGGYVYATSTEYDYDNDGNIDQSFDYTPHDAQYAYEEQGTYTASVRFELSNGRTVTEQTQVDVISEDQQGSEGQQESGSNIGSVSFGSGRFERFTDRLPDHPDDTMYQTRLGSDGIRLDTGARGFCGLTGYRRDVSDIENDITGIKFEAEASRDRYAGTPGLTVNGEIADTFTVDDQPNQKSWDRNTYTVDTSSTEVETIGFAVQDTSTQYCNYLDHSLTLSVYDASLVLGGVTEDDDDVPTFKGEPRSDYTYTGTQQSLFERWQQGEVSTKYFQTNTARGDGTASLELDTSNPPPLDDSTYSKLLDQGETIAEDMGKSDGDDRLVLKQVKSDGTVKLREPGESTKPVPSGETRRAIIIEGTSSSEYIKACSSQPDSNRASVVVSTGRSELEGECPGPGPVRGSDQPPTDPDNDIVFEDVDGDGQITREDADLLGRAEDSIAEKDVQFFDPNGNGEIEIFMYTAIGSELEGPEALLGDDLPTDPDSDGLFEDVDGDGEVTEKDLDVLEGQIDAAGEGGIPKEDIQYFDADGDGEIGDQMISEIDAMLDSGPLPVADSDNSPRDPDGDGLFEDVDGSGQLTMSDANLMSDNLAALSPDFFDFDGDGSVSQSDVTSLRSEVARSNIDLALSPNDPSTDDQVRLSISDPESPNVENATFKWGDGAVDRISSASRFTPSNSISARHEYESQGDYAVDVVISLTTGVEIEATTEVSVESSNLPTYKGVPRREYSYTGNSRNLFEQWQRGEISTTAFQFRTDRGEGTASLVLESQDRNITLKLETSGPVADRPTRFSVSSDDGEVEEAKWDFDNDGLVDSEGSRVQYTYQKPGSYTVQASVETENGYSEDLTLPIEVERNEESLRYDVASTELPDVAADKDVLSPRVSVRTNAQEVLLYVGDKEVRLFDDGDHADSQSGDMLYSNTLNVGDMIGQKRVGLRFSKGDQTDNRSLGEIEFLRTPPKPGLQLSTTDDEIVIDTSRGGFPAPTSVSVEVYESSSETTQPEETVDLKCTASSECKARVDNSFADGSTLLINATQSYQQLTSKAATDSVSITDERRIESVSTTDQRLGGEIELVSGQSWSADGLRLDPVGFSAEDIDSAHITVDGERQQRLSSDTTRILGYLYFGDEITIPSETIGSEDEVTLGLELELSDGTVLSEDVAQASVVEDNTPPEEISIQSQPLLNDPSGNVKLTVSGEDDLSNSVQFQLKNGEDTVFSGETDVRTSGAFAETQKVSISDAAPELSLSVTDSYGNTATASRSVIVDPDRLLEGVELNGNPRSKINLVVYGQGMSTSETREALNQDLEFYFTEQDLSVHGNFRDYFNWYIVDSQKELCDEFDPQSDSLGDDCPTMTDDPSSVFGQTDSIKRGRTAAIVLSEEGFRSYMIGDYTLIADQDPSSSRGIDTNVFAHELGHLIWGFDDEYGGDNRIIEAFSTQFFQAGDNSEGYDVENYSNTFKEFQECEAKMRQVYDSLGPDVCEEQKNGAVVVGDEGRSLMYYNSPTYYPTHVKRINYLLENSPVMRAS